MKTLCNVAVSMALIGALVICTTPAFGVEETSSPDTHFIPVEEVYSRGIAGYLGEPMGTIVAVHAKVIEGASLGPDLPKVVATSVFLDADRVDDRILDKPVRLTLATRPSDAKDLSKQITWRGYETGGYQGLVDDAAARKYAGGGATAFRFNTVFVRVSDTAESTRKNIGQASPRVMPVSIADVFSRGVGGLTGQQMGKVVVVRGKLVRGMSLYPAVPTSMLESLLIDVEEVDGRKLKRTIRLNLAGGLERRSDVLARAWDNRRVTFRGYETGGYDGVVNDLQSWKDAGGGASAFGFKMTFMPLDGPR
jgi:hypothetical protein